MTNEPISSSVMGILQLIQDNNWSKLTSSFLQPNIFQALAAKVNESSSFNGMTLLHAVCRFNPPPYVVKKMIMFCPDDAKSLDCLNRTALHVATGTGACYLVIDALLAANPDACRVQDADGRTPLHMACDRHCVLFEGSSNGHDAPRHDIVSSLLSVSPSTVTLEDDDEMTAIEYALLSSADMSVIRMLQRAAQRILRKKHKEERRRQHVAGFSPRDKVFHARSA